MHPGGTMARTLLALLATAAAVTALTGSVATATGTPSVVRDVRTGADTLTGATLAGTDSIQDYIQPDTEIEPSIAVNPTNVQNAIAVYQLSRIADGGDATNGFTTTFDGGATWKSGTLPGLTTFPGQ